MLKGIISTTVETYKIDVHGRESSGDVYVLNPNTMELDDENRNLTFLSWRTKQLHDIIDRHIESAKDTGVTWRFVVNDVQEIRTEMTFRGL